MNQVLSVNQFIENHSKGKNVRLVLKNLELLGNFRASIGVAVGWRWVLIGNLRVECLPKVDDFYHEAFHEENVLWLHVQVNDFVDVKEPQSLGNLTHYVNDFFHCQSPPTIFNQVAQIVTCNSMKTRQLAQQCVFVFQYVLVVKLTVSLRKKSLNFVKSRNYGTWNTLELVNDLKLMNLLGLIT